MRGVHTEKSDGLTLVEVMVAITIFAMFIAGSCYLFVRGRQMSDVARDHYVAINIAKNRLEKARTFDFDYLHTFNDTNVVVNEVGVADPEGNYRRSTRITLVKPNLAKLEFTIQIRNRNTSEFGIEDEHVSSYVANYWIRPEEE